jgi:hypothetical protein
MATVVGEQFPHALLEDFGALPGSGLRVRRCGLVVRRYTNIFRKWAL